MVLMKKIVLVMGLVVLMLFVVACAPGETLAGQAVKQDKTCLRLENGCGFATEAQLEQKLNDFAKKIDQKNVSAAFGGCPAGSTASICIDSQKAYCIGSLVHGSQIIDCGQTSCSGRFPSGGCWSGETQGNGQFKKEKPDSTSFGGCPMGSVASVCVDGTQLFCLGSEQYGDQIISCGPPGSCTGNFPSAKCN